MDAMLCRPVSAKADSVDGMTWITFRDAKGSDVTVHFDSAEEMQAWLADLQASAKAVFANELSQPIAEAAMARQCAWCGVILGPAKPSARVGVSHGICAACAAKQLYGVRIVG